MNSNWQAAIASHWLSEIWVRSIQEVLESFDTSGSASSLQASADRPNRDAWAGWNRAVWHQQECDLVPGAALRIGAPHETLSAVWKLVSGEDVAPEDDLITALETFRELLSQAATSVAAEMGRQAGHAVRIAPAAEGEPLAGDMPAVEIRFEGVVGTLVFALGVTGPLAQALFDEKESDSAQPGPGSAASADASQAIVRQGPASEDSLRLLRKVELDLAVSFGQTTMTLEQAMKLASGAIVELNRSVSDPVELLVNDSVIARGEVVVVDGNYGVRITEIARPSERILDFSS